MIILTALFVATWIAITVLGNQGYLSSNQSESDQGWNSIEPQMIAIPVRADRRFPRN